MRRRLMSLALLIGLNAGANAVELSISCSALGQEYEICKQGVDAWAKQTGNTVKIVSTPNSATERLALYQQLLAANAPDIDVFQIDVVWSGILAPHFQDLTAKAAGVIDKSFPSMIETSKVQGQARGDAVVRRCGPALLPQGPPREARQARAPDLGRAHRDREGRAGRRAQGRAG